MLFNRLSLLRFSVKKQIKTAGLIVDPQNFRKTGIFQRFSHWIKNTQTFSDMERQLSDFKIKKSTQNFVNLNNKLLQVIQKQNLRDLDIIVNQQYFKQIKNSLKNNDASLKNMNIFEVNAAKIVQARSFTQSFIRSKSTDQWYQITVEYQNEASKRKVYHVLERYYKHKDWRFIKFNA